VDRLVAMECSVRRALEGIASAEKQLTATELRAAEGQRLQASAARDMLRGIRDRFESDPRGAAPLNLSRKITRMREEIEGYTGRPTAAQLEWVSAFEQQLQDALRALEKGLKEIQSSR
jgi:hypothetical protein